MQLLYVALRKDSTNIIMHVILINDNAITKEIIIITGDQTRNLSEQVSKKLRKQKWPY